MGRAAGRSALRCRWLPVVEPEPARGHRVLPRPRRSLVGGHCGLGDGLVLDGEIVAPDPATGAPDFARLQQRMHAKPSTALLAAVRVDYVVFDVLFADGISTMDQPYLARREILDGLDLEGGLIRVPPFWTEIDPDHLLVTAEQAGLKGL